MQMAACVLVGIGSVRLLIEFIAVLEDISTVFNRLATGNVTMKGGKAGIHLRM